MCLSVCLLTRVSVCLFADPCVCLSVCLLTHVPVCLFADPCPALQLNLASQSVLEGLNACFDHRAEIYIPELGMSFQVQHHKTRIFGCQNPFTQGGGRKGLPKSFLNRFTQVPRVLVL